MKLLKTLGLALCSAFLFTPLLSKAQELNPGQVYTTGNIVQDTPQNGPTPWVGGVYQNQLTCWAGGDPGYCGPNAIVRPGNYINFSYGSTYLYQQQNVSTLLPAGSGLQVNGYTFGFTAKNGNGWDDGRADNLTALVRFWDNTGGRGATNLLYGTSQNLSYKYNWTTFNYSETFTTPLAVPSIGQVQYGFIGKDNNGWAGPYGPEVMNVNFSLKYSVDPCASNPLYSPSCKGYLDALAKLVPVQTTTTSSPLEPFTVASMTLPGSTQTTGSPPPGSSPPSQDQQQAQQGQSPPGSPPAGPAPQQVAAQPSANNQQPKAGEVADAGGGKSSSPVSLSSVLSMIGSNQEKTAALEKSVVQAADAQAFSAGESAKQTAEKIAGDAQSQSIAISNSQTAGTAQASSTQSISGPGQNSGLPLQGNLQSNTMFNSARLEQSLSSVNSGQSSSSSSMSFGMQQNTQNDTKQDFVLNIPQTIAYVPKIESSSKLEINTNVQMPKYEPPTNNENMGLQVPVITIGRTQFENKQENTATTQTAILPPIKYEPPKIENTATIFTQITQYQPPVIKQDIIVSMVSTQSVNYSLVPPTRQPQVQIEMPILEGIKFGGNKSPVDSAIEARPIILQTTSGQQTDTVKKNVQNNELAGGVNIEAIAKQPANYAQYFTMIPDVAFYAPKEIYKNQKTIDNARALRLLSSDRLHQEMIDKQYKLGE
jgi:hypothetical protein